ncbi:MAG TPA: hypothetical protein VI072_29220 [Polyangiaceae bacterium]
MTALAKDARAARAAPAARGAERRPQGVALALALSALGCASAPEAPEPPPAVIALAQQYETPTASLDPWTARAALERALPSMETRAVFAGLSLVREIARDASSSIDTDREYLFDLQGAISSRTTCPGFNGGGTSRAEDNGLIRLTLGVTRSRIQRAFSGRAERCRYRPEVDGAAVDVTVTADLELDLGRPLGLGEPLPEALLVRASKLSGDIQGDLAAHLELTLAHFKLREDGTLETLVDLADFGLSGTAVLSVRADQRLGVRVEEGEWICGPTPNEPCELVR